jgi:hypothetical protein
MTEDYGMLRHPMFQPSHSAPGEELEQFLGAPVTKRSEMTRAAGRV